MTPEQVLARLNQLRKEYDDDKEDETYLALTHALLSFKSTRSRHMPINGCPDEPAPVRLAEWFTRSSCSFKKATKYWTRSVSGGATLRSLARRTVSNASSRRFR